MTERKGSNRTQGGLELEAKHQATYDKWWLGKHIETPYFKSKDYKEKITGIAKKVDYIGNSMHGVVEITLDNGYKYLVSGSNSAFRPRRTDVKCIG